MRVSRLIGILAVCAVLSWLCGCAKTDGNRNKPVVTVSIPAQQWLLQQIAGDRMEVQSLLGPESNPETFEPDMKQLMNLEHSRAYFRVGMPGFEEAMLVKVRENFPSLRICDTSAEITPVTDTHASAHGSHDDADPHVWTSLKNARVMASAMLRELIAIDPEGRQTYTDNFRRLDARLKALDDSIAAVLASSRGASFLVWHPSLSYFARDYGLRQLSMESEGKEVSPASLRERIDRASDERPRVFFLQREYDSRQAQALARELDVPTATLAVMQPDIMEQARIITQAINNPGK